MDYPIPTHLKDFLVPVGEENSEYEITGIIRCSCGKECFEVWESNERTVIKLICKNCGCEILLFDSGKHGWDGYVCHSDYPDKDLSFEKYICPECKEDSFSITTYISSQGKEDFIEECISSDDSFSPEEWVNAFEWITVSLSCAKCGESDKEWLDLETM